MRDFDAFGDGSHGPGTIPLESSALEENDGHPIVPYAIRWHENSPTSRRVVRDSIKDPYNHSSPDFEEGIDV